VDSNGDTIDFWLTARRDKKSAKRFFSKVINSKNSKTPRAIAIDKSGANFAAIKEIKNENSCSLRELEIRQVKYLNMVEQDHRFIKRRIKSMLGFKSFNSARRIISGIKIMNILRKEQVDGLNRNALFEVEYINKLFGIKV